MPRSLHVVSVAVASLVLTVTTLSARTAVAQDAERPLVVINVASVERLLDDVDYLFESAERPELSELVSGGLGRMNDLKGMDRDRPVGVMLFLGPGLVPRPVPVGYLPVRDIDDLLKSFSSERITAKKTGEGRYELTGARRTFQVRLQGDYAFVATDSELLDGALPDPAPLVRRLTDRYDLALSVNLKHVPEGMKMIFLDFLRASAEAELQQRDNEPDAQYRVRRSGGMANLALIENMLTQGEDLTLGLDISRERKEAAVDFAVNATPDSEFAAWLRDIGGKRSRFSQLLSETTPLTLSLSWMLDAAGRKLVTESLHAAETGLAERLGAQAGEEDAATAKATARQLFQPLKATAEQGHIDLFLQFVGRAPGKFVLVGGLGIAEGDDFARSLRDLLQRFEDHPDLADLRLHAAEHGDIAFHRIEGRKVRRQDELVYGSNPALYVGSGRQAVWFAVGGDDALPLMKEAIDAAAAPAEERDPDAPFRLNASLARWLDLGSDDEQSERLELAREAFSKGDDRLRMDFRPTDSGARLRLQFEEGFLRLLGLSLARRYDRSRL